jgi:hypothetical protein
LVAAGVTPAGEVPASAAELQGVVTASQPDGFEPTASATENTLDAPLSRSSSGDAQGSSNSSGSDPEAQTGEPSDAGVPAADDEVPTSADPTAATCAASQSLGPDGDCYALLPTLRSWADARQSCQFVGEGWDLASIRSSRTNEFVAQLLTTEAWLGATDAEADGVWLWIDDREQFWRGNGDTGGPVDGAYANWNRTEPNGANSDCARIVPALNAVWADLECSAMRAALCAGPPRSMD